MPRAHVAILALAALGCAAALQLAPRPAESCRGAAAAEPCSGAAAAVELCSRGNARMLRLRGGSSWSSWFKGLLSKLGIFSKTGKLLVLGLDNAGKSTLLTLLVRNEVVPHAPTHQPVTDMITIGSMKMRAVDMGGHEIARRMWEMYSQAAAAAAAGLALAPTPTLSPTRTPTLTPTLTPSLTPSLTPTLTPSLTPTLTPTWCPTTQPEPQP
jgi:hypothetical protein